MSALKVDVSIAQPFVVAGTPFTLTTTFENNHEGNIEVLQLSYHVPFQVQWVGEQAYRNRFEETRSNFLKRAFLSHRAWRAGVSAPGAGMVWGDGKTDYNTAVFTLVPGESGTYSFSAVVRRWLFAAGGDLVFPGQVKYRYNGEIHHHTFQVRFTLRPPLLANCIGAIVGSVVGPVASGLRDQGPTFFSSVGVAFIAGVTLTAILSVVAVIYSSRKTGEAQPIITVEDFWGGLLVGFLVGFLGSDFFGKLVPIGAVG
ncbi:hypothetical protein [Peristeroidobacter soli]|uniref:hypothetical protein n=1 Tax=Peristeroidobacter soli TaxID=2497877 RepID=UPI00101CD7CC|nr:hypothetical protein [Peristeroidobacter soli]